VFENRVLRRIFGPKRDEVAVERRKLQNGELYNLSSLPDIIRQFKSRRMRSARHVARKRKREMCAGFWWESQKKNNPRKTKA
jgi:hypothetical protein